uniref:LisH domain-containing protein n=1 Tax=Electrophorus electricus TaxID=8005 RepID=A0A4W4FFL0_ELEEL
MFAKGKGTVVPSDGQAREKLALYVYEYLLHVGAQKSAQTFLSEIRWEKNITLGEPPGFLHSWWCVFWDLYCAAPERRDTCDHSSEAKAFHDYVSYVVLNGPAGSQASPHAQPPPNSNVMGAHGQPFMSPRYAGGPRAPIRMGNQVRPCLKCVIYSFFFPSSGHPNLGPMQRMTIPRGMGPMGPGLQSDPWLSLQNYGGGMRPPNSMGPNMAGVNMGPGTGRPWPNPNNVNTIPYSSSSPGTYVVRDLLNSYGHMKREDSTNSGENLYTMINSVPPGGNRPSFPMGPDGPLGGMEPQHMNGSLGSGDIDGLPKNSPNNLSSMSNPPGTPRDDGDLGGNFLHTFPNENYSPTMTMSV